MAHILGKFFTRIFIVFLGLELVIYWFNHEKTTIKL